MEVEKKWLLNSQGYIALLDHMGTEIDIVNAARVSYDREVAKFGEKDERLLKYLLNHKHTSPLEMVVFKFEVYCPIFVRSQWFRHRTWSYNEVSRRYTEENIKFYTPEKGSWRKQSNKNKQLGERPVKECHQVCASAILEKQYQMAKENFTYLRSMGVCREQARMLLPQSTMTKFIAKVDLNNLIKFLKLRDTEDAQYEIRVYAEAIKELIRPICPTVMAHLFPQLDLEGVSL